MKLTTLLAAAAMASGLATGAVADGHEPTKVGFVYVGPIGDGGWTYQHDQGRLAVEAAVATKSKPSIRKTFLKGPTPNAF